MFKICKYFIFSAATVSALYGGNLQLVSEFGFASSPINALTLDEDNYIYIFNASGEAIICDFENKRIFKQCTYHSSKYRSIGLSRDGKLLLPTANNIYTLIYNRLSGAVKFKFSSSLWGQPTFGQNSVLFQLENRTLVWLHLENLKTQKLTALSDYSHVFYSDEDKAFFIAKEKSIYRIDENTSTVEPVFSCGEYIHSFVKIKNKFIYHVSTGIHRWSEGTIAQIYKRKSSSLSDSLSRVIFSPTKDKFVILFGNNQAKIHDIDGNELYSLPEDQTKDIYFSLKASFLYTIISDHVCFYSASTGAKFSGLERCSDIKVLLVSDNEENVYTGHQSGLIRHWEIFKDTISEPETFEDIPTEDPLIGEFISLG